MPKKAANSSEKKEAPRFPGEFSDAVSFSKATPFCGSGDFDETRLRDQKRPPPRPKSEPSEAGPIWKGEATKRYKVFGASPQTDAGNVVSAVCSDAVSAAGVEYPRGTSSRCALGRPLASGGDSDETRLRDQKRPPPVGRSFVVPAAGVEPARVISPTDFESVTSANSITPACASHITITFSRLQALFPSKRGPGDCRSPCKQSAKCRLLERHNQNCLLIVQG